MSYDLYLEAGTYTITSGHREWWDKTRPMDVLLKTDAGETTIGSVSVSKSVKTAQFSYTFTLDTAQTVTYTLKSTAKQAPVLSWLGVSKYITKESEYFGQALEDNNQLTDFFQRNQFTYNLNLKYNYIQEGTGSRAAVFLGNSDSTAFRVIPAKSQSQSVLRVGTNAGAKDYPLTTALTAGDWHALSIVYTEDVPLLCGIIL